MNAPDAPAAQLTALLAEGLDPATAAALSAQVLASGQAALVLELLMDLRASTRKVTAEATAALPEVLPVLTETRLALWLDVVLALSERSGATALRFCRESAELFRRLPPAAQSTAMQTALELAEQDAPMALEGLRQAAGVEAAAGLAALPVWARIGAELAAGDDVLGMEYFRCSPDVLTVLPLEELKAWAAVALKLVTPNSLGKPDYMAALTYYRTSPLLLGDLPTPSVRRWVVSVAGTLAVRWPEQAVEFLGGAPGWLRRISDSPWQERVLKYGMLIAEDDAQAALAYFRRAPEVLAADGAGISEVSVKRFEEWYRGGMEALAYNPEAARAYFAVETRKALEAIERVTSTVALREIARMLKFFAEGLSGRPVTIRPLGEEADTPAATQVSEKEALIGLPPRMARYPSREQNLLLYKVLTAHEAGHLEYGTYALDLAQVEDLAVQARLRYGRSAPSPLRSLEELFQLYPHPLLIKDLWMLAEDARIDACLKANYPGLRRAMDVVTREELSRRSLLHGMSVRELVMEYLLRLSSHDAEGLAVPSALEDVVHRAWALLQGVTHPAATAVDVLRAVHRAYVLIEELTASDAALPPEDRPPEPDHSENPRAGEEQGGAYHPLATLAFRGTLQAEQIPAAGPPPPSSPQDSEGGRAGGHQGQEAMVPAGASLGSEEATGAGSGGRALLGEPQAFLYDEWDGTIRDYRLQWCRVLEEDGPEGAEAFVEQTRHTYGGTIRLLRRYFEAIRPPALRRVRRQADGEEVDLDAVIAALVERQASACPSECVYIRRERWERDVAAAFLVDLSGSTGRHIGPEGRRIIDVEKASLVLLCEALEAVGDQYGVYGYSGRSRHEVRFLVLKDFDERYSPRVWRRFDAVQPLVQNRDGAAIRHALHKLSAREARVKLLMVLSDGRPLDDHYVDEYALEDTRAALREAQARGVHVFGITVDQEAPGYLARLYGDVCHLIIDRAESLPQRLPRIYKKLTT